MLNFFRELLGQKILNYYHLIAAMLANIFYGWPSRKLKVIGVTGTDGKTTTVNLIASVMAESGPVSFLSSINARIGDRVYDTGLHTTTPSAFLLQRMLSRMVRAGSKYAVLEVTSHALDQFRTWGIKFDTAVISNITPEHLDYHKTYENYVAAKARLFKNVKHRILNMDDQSFKLLGSRPGDFLSYGLSNQAQIWADQIQESLAGTKITVHTPKARFEISLNIPGRFNVYNALAAIAVGDAYDVEPQKISTGLSQIKNIPGRLEMIGKRVMVDFAHTPNALAKLFDFLRPKISGRIIHVFGSAGERDSAKRPLMGEVSDKYADIIVLTREDNRSEKVEDICEQIAKGIKRKEREEGYFTIPDRREAIKFAIKQAQDNDLVVVTGKGHEQSLNVDGKEIEWDDRKVVKEEFEKI